MAYGDGVDEGYAEGEEKLHFYYNQEERLKNAPKIVQDYYSGNFRLNKGFFRVLVATRSNRFALLVLILCLVMVLFTSLFASFEKGKIADMNFFLSSFSFEEEIYVSLKITPAKKRGIQRKKSLSGLSVPLNVKFSSFDIDRQLIDTKTISGNFNGDELYIRTKFSDYDILTVSAEISALEQQCSLKATVQRK